MAKNIQIIRIQSMIIMWLHLVILTTRFSLLVDPKNIRRPRTPKLSYLISTQINGRQKLHFHSLQLSESTFWLHLITRFSICCYGTISRQASVLIFGGRIDSSDSSLIAKYTDNKWESIGNLQDSRDRHRAIVNDDRLYVIGGSGTRYVILHSIWSKNHILLFVQQNWNLVTQWERRCRYHEDCRTKVERLSFLSWAFHCWFGLLHQ